MATHKLTFKDLQLNVSIRGQGSPLLLLNGLGGLIPAFDPLRDELTEYRTMTLDVPGVGKSQMPHWPMRLPRHADLIAEMLQQLGVEQVDVLGVSWGGALAQEFALRHPRMVRRLILAATSAGPVMLIKPTDILGLVCRNKSADLSTIQTLLRLGVVKGMLTANPRTYYHQLTALFGWTSLPRLCRLPQRTLILTGNRDTIVRPYNARILRSVIRHSEVNVLQGEGHLFVVTSARRTAEAVRRFLGQRDGDDELVPMNAPGMLKLRSLQPEQR